MPLPDSHKIGRRGFVQLTTSGWWVIALVWVFVASFVGLLVVVITGAGTWQETLFQHPQAMVLLLIAVASLLVASIVEVAAAMKRRTRSRLTSPAMAVSPGPEPATCAMGAEHLDVFSARMCDIGSMDDACVARLEKIAHDHPDRATRQQAAERLKTHRAWSEELPAVPSPTNAG